MSDNKNIRFLLGSNTKRGFVPLFNELRDPVNGKRLYIIKGGPGSGKSSLMKRIIKVLDERKHLIEHIHCSSDPDSLDAFIDYDAGIAMVDGTAPHIFDPQYPGAYDVIINMADCWDEKTLIRYRSDIISLSDIISSCHQMAGSCIAAAAALLDNNIQMARPYVRLDIVSDFIRDLMKKLEGADRGRIRKRLLSAVSVGETVFFDETIDILSPSIYEISDKWGAASDVLLSGLYHASSLSGPEQIICYCSLRTPDKIDHIIYPDAGIAISTANSFHRVNNCKHHPVPDLMKPLPDILQEQMTLHLDKAKDMIDMACLHIKKAKLLHDELEAIYIKAMDYSKVDVIYKRMLNEIL
jgi:hypothetical protein